MSTERKRCYRHGRVRRGPHALIVALAGSSILVLAATACEDDGSFHDRVFRDATTEPLPDPSAEDPPVGVEDASAGEAPSMPPCLPARAADSLPPRASLMRARTSAPSGVFTSDLFGLFQSICGGCHVDNSLGGLQVSLQTFATRVGAEALTRLTSDDPKLYMPPAGAGGKPFSQRAEGDPVLELAGKLEAWLAAGRPPDVFYPASGVPAGESSYLLREDVALQMTNIGNCIPPKQMIFVDEDRSRELDQVFAAATELPERLEDTDLFTLDAELLARSGTLAFAPAYTLWADDAKKIRMVRVPRGESLVFDPETQSFSVPPNTRLYKTFLKKVVDLYGNEAYRKIETRIIVSRPDEPLEDGSYRVTSLFGTYAWNEAETEAVLVRDPLRNGEPFRDRVLTYVLDEQAAEDVITTGPDDLQAALAAAGLTRTYAIPGSERCMQCHMGAPNGSFVLGLHPLQLARRPLGAGGVIEAADEDELSQLQRFLEYGVITGLESEDEVLPLEESQGERKPRNRYELEAQGYMLGNCAHCHNPRGFPSVIAPELRELLDFMPSKTGGIFQFPLERFSPRIFRGTFQNVPQPYITPSLYDRKNGIALPGGVDVGPGDTENYLPKEVSYLVEEGIETTFLFAPWRSLIYRNVDTPFTYEEDFSIYPRMPMNTSSYDCRARQILGSWMVSIPSRMKKSELFEGTRVTELNQELIHPDPQPYEEILPDHPDFERFRRGAETQVKRFERSLRYGDCPDPSLDIVDPVVVREEALVPQQTSVELLDEAGEIVGGYSLRVPERPHFAVTDLTNPPGDWFPRRPDWNRVLVELDLTGLDPVIQDRVAMLKDVVISDALREVALTDAPFGLWRKKEECDFSAVPKVSDYAQNARPRWMQRTMPGADDPVYAISPGAQVFGLICANCHGPQADSSGRLAATIADMTGGQTRVANLRDGIFGPLDDPGENRARVFGEASAATGVSADTWAARYLVFMGLGGTQRTIPTPALQTIRNGGVLGELRPNPSALDVRSANMLSVPLALCAAVLPSNISNFVLTRGDLDYSSSAVWKSALIETNGDLELWRKLCSVDNAPMPVRVVSAELKSASNVELKIAAPFYGSLRRAASYPTDAPIGDARGGVQIGVQASNEAPWCLKQPDDAETLALLVQSWQAHAGAASDPPFCPDAFLADGLNYFTEQDGERWATRGAMNAGLAVFVYLDALANGDKLQTVPFDRCERLPN